MKTPILSLGFVFMLLISLNTYAQIKPVKAKRVKTNNVKVNNKKAPVRISSSNKVKKASTQLKTNNERKCLPVEKRKLERIVEDKIARGLRLNLDKDMSSLVIMGRRSKMNIGNYKVKKPGNDWQYHLNDIRSKQVRVSGNRSNIVLNVMFESDGGEIKGKCPGCRVGNDKRAPDMQWKDPRVLIYLKPEAYKGMLTFNVRSVKLMGKLKMNGPTSKFMPSISSFFKSRIEKAIEKELKQTLNEHDIKTMLGNAFKSEVENIGLNKVISIDDNKDKIYLCNYEH
jgi:hypothetical protein